MEAIGTACWIVRQQSYDIIENLRTEDPEHTSKFLLCIHNNTVSLS